jgi:hypothetical protein
LCRSQPDVECRVRPDRRRSVQALRAKGGGHADSHVSHFPVGRPVKTPEPPRNSRTLPAAPDVWPPPPPVLDSQIMKDALDHLPERQQRELERIKTILLEEFDRAIHAGGGPSQSWRRDGRILKIILFGSYSRDDWVDAPETGYQSDFDILVIVSHEKLTEISHYWYVAEDKIARDPTIGRIVNLIVHTMGEVNQGLVQGQYFWTGVVRDGVELYALHGHPFATPKPITPQEAVEMAERYFDEALPKVDRALRTAELQSAEGLNEVGWRRDVAFSLHQAVERAYACFLLVHAFYFPRSHNIKFLRSQAEAIDKSLVAAWPRDQRQDRRRFEMLKRAYVEARYADEYDLSLEDLRWLAQASHRLRDLVKTACEAQIGKLRSAAAGS